MPYTERYKADTEIFDTINFIDVDKFLVLTPIMPDMLETETMLYLANSKDDDVKRFLPGAYVENIEEANLKIQDFIKRFLFKNAILYCIRPKENMIPIGYVLLHSPLASTGLGEWSVDFWINKGYRKQSIISTSVYRAVRHLQSMNVPIVLAIVDKTNAASIGVIESVGFGKISEEPDGLRFVYALKLN